MPKKTVLYVLPLEMPLVERRVVTAAMTMSQERGRSLSYANYPSRSKQIPHIIITPAHADRKSVARQVAHRFGSEAVATMQLVMIEGGDAMNPSPASGSRLLTPNGLLECLDRVAAGRANSSPRCVSAAGHCDSELNDSMTDPSAEPRGSLALSA